MTHTLTVDYRSSAVSASASLSKAIRDGQLAVLPELMDQAKAEAEAAAHTVEDAKDATSDIKVKLAPKSASTNPLLQANSRGWTPMHVAAASCCQMSYEWWKWILNQHQQLQEGEMMSMMSSANDHCKTPKRRPNSWSTSHLWTSKTDMGQTCIDLLFRSSLKPLPWQRRAIRERARVTSQAIEEVCKCPHLLQELKRCIENWNDHEEQLWKESLKCRQVKEAIPPILNEEAQPDEEVVSIVLEFWKRMHLLLYMAYNSSQSLFQEQHRRDNNFRPFYCTLPIIHLLSSLPWCPEIVAHLALSLYPWQSQQHALDPNGFPTTNSDSFLPLHRCARTRTFCQRFPSRDHLQSEDPHKPVIRNDSGILPYLCRSYPEATRIPDTSYHGRLPLHSALASGKPWKDNVQIIFEAFPGALFLPDPHTGLPCFCLAAMGQGMSSTDWEFDSEVEHCAKQMDQQRLSLCWPYLSKSDKAKALQLARNKLECQRLTTIFQVLIHHPSVLTSAVSKF
jgi:hypothetical protein